MNITGTTLTGCTLGPYSFSNAMYGLWRMEGQFAGYATGGLGNGWMPDYTYYPRAESSTTIVSGLYNNAFSLSNTYMTLQSGATAPNWETTLWQATKTSTNYQFTVEYFIKVTSVASSRICLFSRGTHVYYNGHHAPLLLNAYGTSSNYNTLELLVAYGNGIPVDGGYVSNQQQSYTVSTGSLNIADGSWHHVAVVKPAMQALKVFIDGTLYFDNSSLVSDSAYNEFTNSSVHLFSSQPNFDVVGILDSTRITCTANYSTAFPNPVYTGDFPWP